MSNEANTTPVEFLRAWEGGTWDTYEADVPTEIVEQGEDAMTDWANDELWPVPLQQHPSRLPQITDDVLVMFAVYHVGQKAKRGTPTSQSAIW